MIVEQSFQKGPEIATLLSKLKGNEIKEPGKIVKKNVATAMA
tara:strand:- start:589 stop:714 length:126 start_codon:yes stop_codon:yes gene_type:complete